MKISYIPNTVTALSLVSGFVSIIFTSQGNFQLAAVMIFAAAIFDLTDGIIARLLKTSSQFGVELDSLADIVSFGAAPSFLIYSFHLNEIGWLGALFSSFILIFGALRLARFNTQIGDIQTKGDFTGLPIPLAAITIAMFVLYVQNTSKFIEPLYLFSVPLIIVLSAAMISKIKYNAFPKLNRTTLRGKPYYLALAIIGLILTLLTDGTALFYIILAIVFFGIIRHFIRKIISNNFNNSDTDEIKEEFELKEKQI